MSADVSTFVCQDCGYRVFAVQLAERHEDRTGHDVCEVEADDR